ncbi:N-acetylglucosaminylphosphatidylinositol deacetylase [Brevibacterium mcbrellneri ATCC 49030]|uniref:N-acetylglucosaminylphosphatidylinositol deacetylase n=1 Tax=Brevibacterium mcbrellneri ATCC 49030 TaxID=585530 RepID=D4YPN8_9MICO|nr:PIG-L family deacetylase [Brevibacterium mcbrellneri]EFG46820.1 N-acetylglucosaminylphosphatidylinositol deacetylase [Brevibacterium mcbrellneri ATCC 49030]
MTTVLFIHAHPDDESIMTGGTMAALAARGASVVLVTATRGEGGEVIGETHAHLFGNRPGLAEHRERELAEATSALGVTESYFLGEERTVAGTQLPPRRFEDSGMEWGADGHAVAPAHMPPEALCSATVAEVADYVGAAIRTVRPDLVVTYGPGGGYGHPDHVRCFEATQEALARLGAGAPPVVFAEVPPEVAVDAFDPEAPGFDLTGFGAATSVPSVPAEYPVAVAQDLSEFVGAKAMAMAAHATQITVAGEFFALSNDVGQKILDTEYFTAPGYSGPVLGDLLEYAQEHRRQVPAESGANEVAGTHGGISGAHEGASAGASQEAPEDSGKKSAGRWVADTLHTVLVAVLVCLLGTLQHLNASAVNVSGQTIIVPWGLVLAVAMLIASTWHIAVSHRSTLLVVIHGVVISVGSFILGQRGFLPGQDLLITNFYRSVVWLFAPMVIAGIMAFTLPSLKPQPPVVRKEKDETGS